MKTLKLGGVPYEGSPAECFMQKLDAISKSHPLDPKAFIVDNCSIHCGPFNGNKDIHINSMDSHSRGSGTMALTKICELADECGVGLSLIALGYSVTPTAKLVEWYSRFGFVSGMGNDKDGYKMRREAAQPKSAPIKLKGFNRLH